jgi:hypothetical protein
MRSLQRKPDASLIPERNADTRASAEYYPVPVWAVCRLCKAHPCRSRYSHRNGDRGGGAQGGAESHGAGEHH